MHMIEAMQHLDEFMMLKEYLETNQTMINITKVPNYLTFMSYLRPHTYNSEVLETYYQVFEADFETMNGLDDQNMEHK